MLNKEKTLKQFGKKLQETRLRQGLTQEKLSFIVECDRTHISMIERGLRNPSLFIVFKIAKALKVKMSDLFN